MAYWGQQQPKISEGTDSLVIGPLVIRRVAPGESVIRSESPGIRECGARFRLIPDSNAKFVDEAGNSGSLR
jgi:hypothetical protein